MECGNRLRVGVLVQKTLACRGLRVGPSKVPLGATCISSTHTFLKSWLQSPPCAKPPFGGCWFYAAFLTESTDSLSPLFNQAFEGRMKPQKTADFSWPKIFAENRRKPQIELCHLRSVTFSSAPVNWEAGEEGGCRDRCQEEPEKGTWTVNWRQKIAHKPWIREGLNCEVQTVNSLLGIVSLQNSSVSVHKCTSWFMPPWFTLSVIWGRISGWRT